MTNTPRLPIRGLAAMVLACTVLLVHPLSANAQRYRYEATRLGAFLGAMKYCEERYGESERRYRHARLRAAKEMDDMDRGERHRVIRARERAYERGQFMGNRLDRGECRGLLRASEWSAFSND